MAILGMVLGVTGRGFGGERLMGSWIDETEAARERPDIFLGSFTEVGQGSLGSAGMMLYGGKVQVARALKGGLTGQHKAVFNLEFSVTKEDVPVPGRQYLIFATQRGNEYVQIYKLLPATAANIAKIEKIIAANAPLDTPLGKAVRSLIGADLPPTGPEPEMYGPMAQMVKANAAAANQLVIHEILANQKYRARLGDLWIGRVLEETARSGDVRGSRDAALLCKAWLDLDLELYDTAKDKIAFISRLTDEELWRQERRLRRRTEVVDVLQTCRALGEKRLLGHNFDETKAVWWTFEGESTEVFLGSFTEVGHGGPGGLGSMDYDAKVQATRALKGDVKGVHDADFCLQDCPTEEFEDVPVQGRQYLIFAIQRRNGFLDVHKLLPPTEENIARIQKIVDQNARWVWESQLGQVVMSVIGGDLSNTKPESKEIKEMDWWRFNLGIQANELLVDEILHQERYRAKLAELSISRLLRMTTKGDGGWSSHQAAVLYKTKLDEDLAAYDAAKNKDAFVFNQPKDGQRRLEQLIQRRNEAMEVLREIERNWALRKR